MTKYNITVITTLSVELRPAVTATVKSEAAMWNYLREVRNNITDEDLKVGIQAIVTTEDGKEFKNIVFKKNSKGKIEMPNSVKETCRYRIAKAKAIAAATTEDDAQAEAEIQAITGKIDTVAKAMAKAEVPAEEA